MATLKNKRGASILVYAIIGIIIAVVFFTFAANVIGNFLDEFPKVSGSVADPSKIVCFGGGKDNSIHCLEKLTGQEIFTFEKAKKWKKGGADSSPKLTKEGLYFAVGNHICAYDSTGSIWNNCQQTNGAVTSDIEAGFGLVCFGTTNNEYTCLNQKDGSPIPLTIKAKEKCLGDTCSTLTKPIVTENYIYAGLGSKVCKYDQFSYGLLDENSGIWKYCIGSFAYDISNIEIKNDLVCFGATNNKWVDCFNDTTGISEFISSSYSDLEKGFAGSKPHLDGDSLYLSLGAKLYKWDLLQNKLLDLVDFGIVGGSIDTDLTANDEVVCFGGSGSDSFDSANNGAAWCSTKNDLATGFSISPRINPDATDATSTPAIDNGILYFGLGDYVCAYDIELAKNATNHRVGKSSAEKWCADFDHQINSGIAGLEKENE